MVASQKILLQLAATGMKAELIATNLGIDKRTVENRLMRLRRKFSCNTTLELVLYSIARGMIKNPFEVIIQTNTGRD